MVFSIGVSSLVEKLYNKTACKGQQEPPWLLLSFFYSAETDFAQADHFHNSAASGIKILPRQTTNRFSQCNQRHGR
jgi:hypothetical protein